MWPHLICGHIHLFILVFLNTKFAEKCDKEMRFCGKIRILWKNGNFIWKCEFFGEMHIFRKNANFILKCKFRGQMLILFLSVNLTEKFEFFFELQICWKM